MRLARSKRRGPSLGAVLLCVAGLWTGSECRAGQLVPGTEWKPRDENRKEGILRQQDVAGDLFRLIGVELKAPVAPTQASPKLELWTPPFEARFESVRVHELRSNYLMVPGPAPLRPGDKFDWPTSAVVGPARVPVDALRVLVSDGDGRFYPALLRDGSAAPPAFVGYRFCFYSRGGFDIRWSVAREKAGVLTTLFESGTKSPQGGLVNLEWNGRSADLQAVEAGPYRLLVEGRAVLGGDKQVSLDIPFVAYAQAPQ